MKKNDKYYYGYIPSPKDIRNYKIAAATKEIDLPEKFEVKHSKIKNQGNVGSCVAHGISEVLETNDSISYSTGWIYGYRPSNYYQGSGMVPSEALKTVNKVGYISNDVLNINIEMDDAKKIVDRNLSLYKEEASKKKIVSYARLNNIKEIKQAIYDTKKPVLVCFEVGENGLVLDKKYVAKIPTNYIGGHLTVCYGWNETGLLIQNSWGQNWGNKGTFILPYEYPFSEAWVMTMPTNEEDDLQIKKPNFYIGREFIMILLKLLRKCRK